MSLPKMMACVRRKSNLTRKEFFDYHFRVHGSISDTPQNPDDKPHKYLQIHFFDAAFGERPDGIQNTGNHPWVGRDDMIELTYRDWDHLKACFGSEYVRTVVGPDGRNFNDFETTISLMALEKPLTLKNVQPHSPEPEEGCRTVAVLFPAVKSQPVSEQELEETLSPQLTAALEEHASHAVWGVIANVGIPPTQFDARSYFGGNNMPNYPVTYKILLTDSSSTTAVRKAQKAFMDAAAEHLDASNTFIAFGKEGLVLDVARGIQFDISRQPQLPDLV